MATELKVPTLGMDMEEATILRWMVEEGAAVEKGDPVLEIETDKTSFEVEANGDGEIRNLRGEEGEALPVGAVLAYIASPGEEAPTHEEPEKETQASENGEVEVANSEEKVNREPVETASPEPNGDRRRVRASPAARRAAEERGFELEDVAGSGPQGRIYLSDVLEFDERQNTATNERPTTDAPESVRREPLSRVRRLGAERTAKSFSEVPHFYLRRDMEVDRLLDLRERLKHKMDPAPGVTELLALAISRTLKDHPRLNARYAGDGLELHESVNLGLAVATENGLVVPVLGEADALTLRELVPVMKDLIGRSRGGKLGQDELSGGTFTVSNLGMMGIDSFDAVINTPEAAILAVGRTRTVPKWYDGEWLPHRIISMTLSVDHRVADGADGSRFLEDLQNALTNWELLI